MQKKKLLVLSSTYPRWDDDWEPAFVHELSKRLTDEFDVSALCPREKGSKSKEIKDQVNVIRYRYAPNFLSTLVSNGGIAANLKSQPLKWLLVPLFFLFQTLAILIAIKRDKPDVIHCHWIIPQGICLYLAKKITRSKIPHLLTSHGGDLYSFRGKLLTTLKRKVLRSANAITVVSQAMIKEAERIAEKELDISAIPMGIDTENTFYRDENIQRSKTEILFVGRLVEKKGVTYLLEALQIAQEQLPDLTLTIIGEGPERKKLENKANTLKISESVTFLGSVPNTELPNFYRKAAVFVAPFITSKNGDQEGFGLVIAEAVNCGCPTIVSNIEPLTDVLQYTECAGLILTSQQKSGEDLANQITHLLRNRNKLKIDDSTPFTSKINWNTIAANYIQAINQTMELAS